MIPRMRFAVALSIAFTLALSAAPSAQPTISSFTPTSGAVGASVTITGTGFSATADNNIVYFGATKATVTSASTTSLTVTVPVGATFRPITVSVGGSIGYSSQFFLPTFEGSSGAITSATLASKVDFPTGTSPYAVAMGDLDGDGKPDLSRCAMRPATMQC